MTVADLKALKTDREWEFWSFLQTKFPDEHECKIVTRMLLDLLNQGKWPEYKRVHLYNQGRLYWFRHISHGALRPSPEEIDAMVEGAIDRLIQKGLLVEMADTTILPNFLLQVHLGLVP